MGAQGWAGRGHQAHVRVLRVVASAWYVLVLEHDVFELELAAYPGVEKAVLIRNSTDAVELGLAALGVTTDDRVFAFAFAFAIANAGAHAGIVIGILGAVPVYAAVDPATRLLSPATTSTRAMKRPALSSMTGLSSSSRISRSSTSATDMLHVPRSTRAGRGPMRATQCPTIFPTTMGLSG